MTSSVNLIGSVSVWDIAQQMQDQEQFGTEHSHALVSDPSDGGSTAASSENRQPYEASSVVSTATDEIPSLSSYLDPEAEESTDVNSYADPDNTQTFSSNSDSEFSLHEN